MKAMGRRILLSVTVLTAAGGFLADWTRTHQPRLAAARQVPRRPDHTPRLAPWGKRALLLRGSGERDLAMGALLPALY
jgi:hypothetical protein